MFFNRVVLVRCGRDGCVEWHYEEFKDADHEQKIDIPAAR